MIQRQNAQNTAQEKLIYVASPLRGATSEIVADNMERAKQYVAKFSEVLKDYGIRAIAPHAVLPNLLNDFDERQRELAMEICFRLIKICVGLIVVGNATSGMLAEMEYAHRLKMPVFLIAEEEALKYWYNGMPNHPCAMITSVLAQGFGHSWLTNIAIR